jgi:penicillin-binding protein 1C
VRIIVTALFALALCAAAYLSRPIRARDLPAPAGALEFLDRNGLPLGTILGRDDRHTFSVPLAEVSPYFVRAVLAAEDERFYAHGALDPLATMRSLRDAVRERRLPHGASTISIQLARLLEPVPPTPLGKLREILLARRLELGLSKREILEAYCNRAPMGSNLYGVEAAARSYFGAHAAELDLAQASLLAALPNDPVRLDPYRHLAALRRRRDWILERMRAAGSIDDAALARARDETLVLQPRSFGIVAAPHFLFSLAAHTGAERTIVRTTLDRPLQTFVEAQVRAVVASLADHDVHQAAVLVIDNRSARVLAYAGSADYFGDDDFGRNDGVRALRQPGSALKPFLYELALERRDVRPTTILADVPAAYALPDAHVYRPADYSERFAGPVRVRAALADSLNVPAVRVLARVGVDAFLTRLHELGFAHLDKPAAYYGLGLTLGGGEVSLWELARAYVALARGGTPVPLATTLDEPSAPAPGEARDPAWTLVTDMLADRHARAASFGVNSILALPFPAAVKTGTSSDFRDTWTAGFTRDYTVAVWVGNFDGRPMRDISGVSGAGPLWSRIMLHLHEANEPRAFERPRGYVRRPICASTGTRPGPDCNAVVDEWLDALDLRAYDRVRAHEPGREYDAWLVSQPERERLATRVLFPHDGDVFVDEPGAPNQQLRIEIAGAAERTARVSVGGRVLANDGSGFFWPVREGTFQVVARAGGSVARAQFSVIPPPQRRHHLGFTIGSAVTSGGSPGTP